MEKKELDKNCKRLAEIKRKKSELKKQISALDSEFKEIVDVVNDAIVDLGQKHWYVKGVATFAPSTKHRISVVDQQKLKAYLKKHALEDLITVYPQTISEWAKEEIDNITKKNKKFVDTDLLNEYLAKTFGISTWEEETISITGDENNGKKK